MYYQLEDIEEEDWDENGYEEDEEIFNFDKRRMFAIQDQLRRKSQKQKTTRLEKVKSGESDGLKQGHTPLGSGGTTGTSTGLGVKSPAGR